MKTKIIHFFYNLGLKGWENYLMLLLCIVIVLTLTYAIVSRIVKNKYESKHAVFNRMTGIFFLVFFSFFAWLINLLINFSSIQTFSSWEHLFSTPPVTVNPFGFMPDMSYCKISDYEYIRCISEVISFIPIGVCIYRIAKSKRVVKASVFAMLISMVFELLGNHGHISKYYWPTLINNILGTLVGVGLVMLLLYTIKKQQINKIHLILSQLPLCVVIVTYGIMYMYYFTNVFGGMYPDYYEKLDSDKINVTYMCDTPLEEKRVPSCGMFSEEDFYQFAEALFELRGTSVDESKTKFVMTGNTGINEFRTNTLYECITNDKENVFCYKDYSNHEMIFFVDNLYEERKKHEDLNYSEEEMRDMLKKCDINEAKYFTYDHIAEIDDGIYIEYHIKARFDDEGVPYYLYVSNQEYSNISMCKSESRPDKLINVMSQINYITIEEAYEKLCAGECYAPGLVETTQKGMVDIVVNNVRLESQTDNSNRLQYVYCFDVEPIEVEGQAPITKIYVPAMKDNKLFRNRLSSFMETVITH